MKTLQASEAKENFAHLIDLAYDEPVRIESDGRPTLVMLSLEDFDRFRAEEDAYWIARAEEGQASGYLSVEESEAQLKRWLNAPD